MAIYRFSALSDGQSIAFNTSSDVLNFDETSIAAADIRATIEGSNLRISVVSGPQLGKDVLLLNVAPTRLTTTNVTFADGSRLLFGDNTTGTTNDNSSNSLTGTSGNDQLAGFGGVDTLDGGAGNDLYVVTSGDVIRDSGGNDTVESSTGWSLASGLENLTLTGTSSINANGNNLANLIIGNSGNNGISAREGNDTLIGNAGNDKFIMSNGSSGTDYGNDSIDGGSGVDTLDYGNNARTPVSIDLAAGTASGGGTGGAGSATFVSVENANGGGFNDLIKGSSVANFLYGHNGNDTIDGVEGRDRLEGGGGADRYVFSVAPGSANADTIVGFVSGTDEIALDAADHVGIGTGEFVSGDARFASGWGLRSARDSSDRVIYDTSNGQLFYDSDGNTAGGAAPQLIATLQGRPALRATDITVLGDGSSGGGGGGSGTGTNGTAGNDSLTGTSGNDTINGLGGNDTINGAGGSDSLDGGAGNDSVVGGVFDPQTAEGGDSLVGGDGDDTLNGINHSLFSADVNVDTLDGGRGTDIYWVDNAADVLIDAEGSDIVHAVNTDWTLGDDFETLVLHTDEFEFGTGVGNEFANWMSITWQGRLEGMGGNDTLFGGTGGTSDELFGGDGNDLIKGVTASLVDGGAGDDTLSDAFSMTGGAGADDFRLDFFDFITDFSSGIDSLIADGAIARFENLGASGRFASADPRFHAAAGATTAQDGDDRFIYNTTTGDLYYDSDGKDGADGFLVGNLQGAPALKATDIEVVNGTAPVGGEEPPPPPPPSTEGQTITGTTANDTLVGSPGDDTIDALYGDDLVQGMGGNDSIFGAAGKDTLQGGDGNDSLRSYWWSDTLTGGAGSDSFVYTEYGTNHKDRITDFEIGIDELVFDNANFGALGDAGAWATGDGRFVTAGGTTTSGQDADDRLIYNKDTGTLYYDSDGGGTATGQIVAVFTGNPNITASDVTVI